jgi:hypothetical protein
MILISGFYHLNLLQMSEYMGISISALDKKISNYLPQLNTQQKKAVWGVMQSYLEAKQENEPLENKAYADEMTRRFEEMENGKVKLYTLDEAEAHARESYKPKKRK